MIYANIKKTKYCDTMSKITDNRLMTTTDDRLKTEKTCDTRQPCSIRATVCDVSILPKYP